MKPTIPGGLSATTLEQRRHIYAEIEQLIHVGFLTVPIQINGVFIGFRSPHPSDFNFLKSYGDGISINTYASLMVAKCIWMVDGQNLLGDDASFIRVLKSVKALPKNIRSFLYVISKSLGQKTYDLYDGVEPYSYENTSRYLWKSLAGQLPCQDAVTGVRGTSLLGLNQLQRTWVFLNQADDGRVDENSRWNSAKLVASAMIGKGIQKINAADESIRKNEADYRQGLMDAYFYYRIGAISRDAFKNLNRNNTSDDKHADLEEEMRKVLTGEKDDHDRVIDEALAAMVDEVTPKKKVSLNNPDILGQTRLVGYTKEQMEKLIKDVSFKSGGPSYSEQDQKKHYFIDKFIKNKISPAKLVIDGDRISVDELSPEESKALNKSNLVENDEENSLDSLLAGRKVVLR